MALNRGEAAVGEAGGEPVMALSYERCGVSVEEMRRI